MANIYEMKRILDDYPQDVLLQIGLPDMRFYANGTQLQALCPFHDDHKLGNFGYNLSKGCWRCFVCGKGGSGVYSLVMAVNNWSFAKAVRFLYDHRDSAVSHITEAPPASLLQKGGKFRTAKPAPCLVADKFTFDPNPTAEDMDTIYSCFAAASPLSPLWLRSLQERRGIHSWEHSYFFRFPSSKDEEFWKQFRGKLSSRGASDLYSHLLGIPGFFWDVKAEKPSFVGCPGALGILNHDKDGLVNGIELRLPDSMAKDMRYMPFSSEGICLRCPDEYKYGVSLGSIVDVVQPLFSDVPIQGVAITEGKFKALQLSKMGYLTLNIRGVGNWRQIFPVLKELAEDGETPPRVFIAFDADSRRNPPVAEHSANLGKALIEDGYETYYLTWPNNCGKGIDDVVNAGWILAIHLTFFIKLPQLMGFSPDREI